MTHDDSISLNKWLSNAGLCSRRQADKLIEAGRVTINGATARKGNRVFAGDQVALDGETVKSKKKSIYLAFHKPRGVTCTTDKRDPSNIIDYIGFPQRIFPIGRLDKDSTGLILMTNDGDIVNDILRERYGHEKEYLVSVNRPITQEFVKSMSSGVRILDRLTKPCTVEKIGKGSFRIILTQGLNRQIRRMTKVLGYSVVRLQRIRIMNIHLGNLPESRWRHLTQQEMADLRAQIRDQS